MAKNKEAKSKKAGTRNIQASGKEKAGPGRLSVSRSAPMDLNSITPGKHPEIFPGAEEPGIKYISGLSQILLANQGRPEYQMSSFEKIELVEEGISKKALENLKLKAGLDYDQLSKVLKVARTTLLSKKADEKFNQDLSDKILGLADIYSYGYEVFEDRDRFNEWIFRQNKALGGQAPFDILNNSFGREEVKHLIGRIDHGVYS